MKRETINYGYMLLLHTSMYVTGVSIFKSEKKKIKVIAYCKLSIFSLHSTYSSLFWIFLYLLSLIVYSTQDIYLKTDKCWVCAEKWQESITSTVEG